MKNKCCCHPCPKPPECQEPQVLGWMRSSETFGFVPGARIPAVPPSDGVFTGWNYPWVRGNTPIQYFENTTMFQAAVSGEFTQEALLTPETLFAENGRVIGSDFIWDGGTDVQFYRGYYAGNVPGGWTSWENVEIADDSLFSPETRENTPGVYLPYHYSLRRFTSYLTVDLSCYRVDSAFLISNFLSEIAGTNIFPLNDSIFVFVNGALVYWAATDIIGSGNVAEDRLFFYDIPGIIVNRNPEFLFTDGWYLALGENRQITNIAPFLRNGKNVVDVIADDYYLGGGMSRIDIEFNITPNL